MFLPCKSNSLTETAIHYCDLAWRKNLPEASALKPLSLTFRSYFRRNPRKQYPASIAKACRPIIQQFTSLGNCQRNNNEFYLEQKNYINMPLCPVAELDQKKCHPTLLQGVLLWLWFLRLSMCRSVFIMWFLRLSMGSSVLTLLFLQIFMGL